jgi:DNA ligase-associated metallophosphoesterase
MRHEHYMNTHKFELCGAQIEARGSGALFWPDQRMLVVSDLHLGKSERIARRGGGMLPPYDTSDTLARLDAEIAQTHPKLVVCLGDSFDDLAACEALAEDTSTWITRLMAGRRWIWIEGNHDPGPLGLAGTHLAELDVGALTFRHIATDAGRGEVSGHYHPKATLHARGKTVSRACFLYDSDRLILPAFGTYTGGLRCTAPELQQLMGREARAVLTGPAAQVIPMPGRAA